MSFRAVREIYNLSFRAQRGISAVFSVLFLALTAPVFAQATPAVISDTAGVHSQICNVFSWMFWILISVSIIMVMWAAFLYVTAQDDAEQTTQAKRALFYAAIGIIVGFLARGFPLLVASIFPGGAHGIQGC